MTTASIGIDPGADGAIAVITQDENGIIASTVPWSRGTFFVIMAYLSIEHKAGKKRLMACVEKVGAMPGQGVTSMFNFGKAAGFIEGALEALEIPYQLIPPATWKKEFQLHHSKQDSIEVCKRLFPQVSLMKTPRCKKEHDGMAEALLMAEYARRKLNT